VKLRDRSPGTAAERIRFTSSILPRWARRMSSLEALLPVFYLRGVSMGDFQEALGALLGKAALNLSPSVIARLRNIWQADYARWQRRDLAARRYVYIWADGIGRGHECCRVVRRSRRRGALHVAIAPGVVMAPRRLQTVSARRVEPA
jgi:hypothetical protein